MKFPDLVHAVKPEPHHGMPQAAQRARHVLGLRLADARIDAHADVGDVATARSRAATAMMQGFGVHTFRFVNAAGESRFVQVPLEPGGRHAFARLGRGGEDLRRRSRLPPPRPVGSDRGRRLSRVGARRSRSSPRRRPSASASTCSTRPRSSPRSWCRCRRSAAWCSTATPTTSSPRPSRSPSARTNIVPGIDFSNDPLLAGRIHSYVDTQLRASAARTSTRSRSTRRSRRCTTTSATACTARRSPAAASPTSRTRSAAAARSRPGMQGFTSFPRAGGRGQGARQAGEVRRALHPGDAVLEQPDRRSRRTHIIGAFRFELTKVQRAGDPRARGLDARNVADELAQGVADGLGIAGAAGRCRACCETPAKPEVDDVAGAVAVRAARATAACAAARSRSWSPTASTASAARARTRRSPTAARCRASSACGSAASTPAGGDADRGRGHAWRRRRRCCGTRWWCRRRAPPALARARPRAGVPQGPVPPLQADPRRSAPTARRAKLRPACRAARRQRRSGPGRRRGRVRRGGAQRRAGVHRALGKHRIYERETDPPVI